jgi:hypothetical protein
MAPKLKKKQINSFTQVNKEKQNSDHRIQQSHWPKKLKNLQAYTNNPILLNIENTTVLPYQATNCQIIN